MGGSKSNESEDSCNFLGDNSNGTNNTLKTFGSWMKRDL